MDEDIWLIPRDKMTEESYPVETSDAVSMCTAAQRVADVQSTLLPCVKQEPLDEQCVTADRCLEIDVSLACLPLLHLHYW